MKTSLKKLSSGWLSAGILLDISFGCFQVVIGGWLFELDWRKPVFTYTKSEPK